MAEGAFQIGVVGRHHLDTFMLVISFNLKFKKFQYARIIAFAVKILMKKFKCQLKIWEKQNF